MAVLLLAIAVPIARAATSRGLSYRSSTTATIFDDFWTTSTTCPTGRVAISGGERVQGAFTRMSLGGSYPRGTNHNRWGTTGLNEQGNRPVHGLVVCARPHIAPTYVIHKMSVPQGGTNIGAAQCPKGQEVAGGGAQSDHDRSVYMHSFPIDTQRTGTPPFNTWTADIYNYSMNPTETAVIYAVCVPKSTGLHYSTQDTILPAGPDHPKLIKQSCPLASDAVVGGGAVVQGGPSRTHLAGSFPSDNATDLDTIPDDAWSVQVTNDSAAQRTVTTYVICRS
jgi:hypothetical protein